MSDHDTLLRGILEKPCDHAAHLVYADWLEERGEADDRARAAFIRLQLEHDRQEREAHYGPFGRLLDEDRDRQWQETAAALEAPAADGRPRREHWLAPLPDAFRYRLAQRRGFPHLEVTLDHLNAFLDLLADGPPPAPWRLRIDSEQGLADLDRLDEALAGSTPPTEVDCSFSHLGDHLLAELLIHPWLAGVTALRLGFSEISNVGAGFLADCPFLDRLAILSFDALHCDEGLSNPLRSEGVAALASSPPLTNLRELDLGQNRVGDDGLRALAGSSTLTCLDWLGLFDTQVTDDGIQALVASPVVRGLRYLDLLGQNDLTDATLDAIAGSPHLGNLETLRLGGYGYSDPDYRPRDGRDGLQLYSAKGWAALCASPGLPRLRHLHLDEYDTSAGGKEGTVRLQQRFGAGLHCRRWT